MHQEHQARVAKLLRDRQRFGQTAKGFLAVDFRAGSRQAGYASGIDLTHNLIAPGDITIHKNIGLVEGVGHAVRDLRHAKERVAASRFKERSGIACAGGAPALDAGQLDPADRGLCFREAPIGADALMQPAIARRMFLTTFSATSFDVCGFFVISIS